jgi:NAD(P)-dependent dehydrogenase (short-subunit alcohol dehydrogenase family)
MSQPRTAARSTWRSIEDDTVPDCGEESYQGSGKLTGKVAVITGGDSGIGRAVAIAYAREGADILISYLSEDSDAKDTANYVEQAGRRAVLVKGDVSIRSTAATSSKLRSMSWAASTFWSAMPLPNDPRDAGEISDDEWDYTFDTNVGAMFRLCKAAIPHMKSGSSIIGSSSVNSDMPNPDACSLRRHQGGDRQLCASLAQMLGEKGIRVNSVAPGPIWTPLIPATMPNEKVEHFGENTPLGRAGQPKELAPVYVLLAADDASYVSGARVAVTGGRPLL